MSVSKILVEEEEEKRDKYNQNRKIDKLRDNSFNIIRLEKKIRGKSRLIVLVLLNSLIILTLIIINVMKFYL